MSDNSKCILVSNRLPYQFSSKTGQLTKSSGGLVTALSGLTSMKNLMWAGCYSGPLSETQMKEKLEQKKEEIQCLPIQVDPETYDKYYNGICNDVFWPSFHYEVNRVQFKPSSWEAYKQVNQTFADKLSEVIEDGDTIWIHDFHLFLLPQLLRQLNKKIKIGFFLHIPFPSSEIFRQLPVREEILKGLLGADLIGFHEYSYLRHFTSSLLNVLGVDAHILNCQFEGRKIDFGIYPVSIDTPEIHARAQQKNITELVQKYRTTLPEFIIAGVDRLDYSKGLELKLKALQYALKNYAELRGKVSLLQIVVPSRTGVPEYQRIKKNIEQLVSEINGEFSLPHYTPIKYMYRSIKPEELLALYQAADALLVTSKRDGMNLVSFEYIAAQNPKRPGVPLVSEFAGSSSVLSRAILINPWNTADVAEKIRKVFQMGPEEKIIHYKEMFNFLNSYTSKDWAQKFISDLNHSGKANKYTTKNILSEDNTLLLPPEISKPYQLEPALLFIDFDGTLVPFADHPDEVTIDEETHQLLTLLKQERNIETVIVSGRHPDFLSKRLNAYDFPLCAEHGAYFYDPQTKEWQSMIHTDIHEWYSDTENIMKDYTKRVPESFIEKKMSSLVWHYRKSPKSFALYQSRKLAEELEYGLANLPARVLLGHKIIEVKSFEATKGEFVKWYASRTGAGKRVVTIGDDSTDEDMFLALPENAVSVKVGPGETAAQYRLEKQSDVAPFIRSFFDI